MVLATYYLIANTKNVAAQTEELWVRYILLYALIHYECMHTYTKTFVIAKSLGTIPLLLMAD